MVAVGEKSAKRHELFAGGLLLSWSEYQSSRISYGLLVQVQT